MDGMHDLGGRQGFGTVRYTLNAPAFHAQWEVRANSLYAFAVRSGIFNMDEYRHAIERMDPRHYLYGELLRAHAHEPRHAAASRRAWSRARSSSGAPRARSRSPRRARRAAATRRRASASSPATACA